MTTHGIASEIEQAKSLSNRSSGTGKIKRLNLDYTEKSTHLLMRRKDSACGMHESLLIQSGAHAYGLVLTTKCGLRPTSKRNTTKWYSQRSNG